MFFPHHYLSMDNLTRCEIMRTRALQELFPQHFYNYCSFGFFLCVRFRSAVAAGLPLTLPFPSLVPCAAGWAGDHKIIQTDKSKGTVFLHSGKKKKFVSVPGIMRKAMSGMTLTFSSTVHRLGQRRDIHFNHLLAHLTWLTIEWATTSWTTIHSLVSI